MTVAAVGLGKADAMAEARRPRPQPGVLAGDPAGSDDFGAVVIKEPKYLRFLFVVLVAHHESIQESQQQRRVVVVTARKAPCLFLSQVS